jgi:hypothetical protein
MSDRKPKPASQHVERYPVWDIVDHYRANNAKPVGLI